MVIAVVAMIDVALVY